MNDALFSPCGLGDELSLVMIIWDLKFQKYSSVFLLMLVLFPLVFLFRLTHGFQSLDDNQYITDLEYKGNNL